MPTSRFNGVSQNKEIRAVFVIDECPHSKFVELAKEVEPIGGRIALITLDFDVDRPRGQDKHIILQPLDKKTAKELIQAAVPNLPDNAQTKIVEYSEGYPQILIRLAGNFNSQPEFLSPDTLNNLGIVELLDRIVKGRGESSFSQGDVKKVLTALSLFKRVGWDDEVSVQGQAVCKFHNIDWMTARSIVEEQERRKLVARRGRYRYVTPLPLAINLASTWLSAMDLAIIGDHFKNMPDAETQKAFLERLTEMGYNEYAQKVAKSFLSSFDLATLNTSTGSQIFLCLSKADHLFSMAILEKILSPLSHDELLEFKSGRRNVVYALEKIAWWGDTFAKAGRILLKLSDAENEEWSNNATGTFADLFQTYLGGTEVPLWERYSVLEEAIASGNKNVQRIALKAVQATLRLSHAYRAVFAEEQGFVIPPQEWNPHTVGDIRKSVSSALNIIDKLISTADREIQLEASSLIISNTRELLALGFVDDVLKRMQLIRGQFPELEKELMRMVEMVLYYDKNLPEAIIVAVQNFRKELIESSYTGLLKRYVGSDLVQDRLLDKNAELESKIKMLAEMSMKTPSEFEKALVWLVTKQAENGYLFGKALGEIDIETLWLKKIEEAIRLSPTPSIAFFGGYLSSIKNKNEPLYECILINWSKDEKLTSFLPELLWQSGTSELAAKLLISMIEEKKIDPAKTRLFAFGAWFTNINLDTFVLFLEKLYEADNGKHASDVLGIISYYVEKNQALLKIKDLVLKYLEASEFEGDDMAAYFWSKLSRELMEQDSDTIPYVLDMLLRSLSSEKRYRLEDFLLENLQFALKKENKLAWNKLKDVLILDDLRSWRLSQIIRGEHGFGGNSGKSLFQLLPEEDVWKWVNDNPQKASYILARMVPLNEAEPALHPVAKKLLTKFIGDSKVKERLSENWNQESFSGKLSDHFQKKLSIAEEWAKDPEPAVSAWAQGEVLNLRELVKTTTAREQERDEY